MMAGRARVLVDVSVVIPCFNAAATLPRALHSVAAQTCTVREIVVVDDGSRDAVSLQEAIANWTLPPPLRLLTLPENRGVACARNRGMQEAVGEFIAFLDADDIWHPRKTEVQLEALAATGLHLASGRVKFSLQDSDWLQQRRVEGRRRRPFGLAELLLHNPVATSTVLLRKSHAPQFDEGLRRAEDWMAWIEFVARNGSGLLIDEYLAGSYKRPAGEAGLGGDMLAFNAAQRQGLRALRRCGVLSPGQALLAGTIETLKLPPRMLVRGLLPRLAACGRRALGQRRR